MSSLTAQVTRQALAGLLAPLAVVGLVTAAGLDWQARRSLDQVLLAGAMSEAHPWSEERWEPPDLDNPVTVTPLEGAHIQDHLDGPHFETVDGLRRLHLPVAPPGERVPTHIIQAEAPAVTLASSVGPFLFIYTLVASLTALIGGVVLVRGLRRTVAPLTEAATALDRVRSLGGEVPLPQDGPDEVRTVLRSVEDLLDRLEKAGAAQARFTAEAAHELRTPVTVLRGELELALRRERSGDEYRQALRTAQDKTRQLCEIVDALMALARLDAGQDAHRQRERPSAIVHEALRRQGLDARVELRQDPELELNVPLVVVALDNLLRNAVRHGRPPIAITVDADAERVHIDVDDHGPGVPEDRREALFDRFVRDDRRQPGLGLGLPLSRSIARRHGGDVTLHDAPTGGLRARLTLAIR